MTVAEAPRTSRHGPIAQLLIAWSPLSLILVAYAAAEWVSAPLGRATGAATNRLGFELQVTGPARADQAVFGTVPTVWLQEHLLEGSPNWYDAVAALVYTTHFVSLPLVTGVTWFCMRGRFSTWLTAVLAFTTIGVAGYVLYPATPPWLTSDLGVIGPVSRISDIGWSYLHLAPVSWLTTFGQGSSNPVAAMPSLHAGTTLLVTLFLWPVAGRLWRAALIAYVVLMGLALVYTGEHYVADVAAGWLTAVVAYVLAASGAGGGRAGAAALRTAVAAIGVGSSGVRGSHAAGERQSDQGENRVGYVIVDPDDVRARPGPHPAASPYDKSVGESLGLTAFAAYFVDLPPHAETVQHDHSHDGVEDLYVVVSGSGWLLAGDERLPVRPHLFITISMDTEHLMLAGEDGMGFVAVCGPSRPLVRRPHGDGRPGHRRHARGS